MSLYNGPPRGGSRGGRDQFNWDSVKSDKDREFYLGHSVKASVGRWQKGKDLLWYTKDKKQDEMLQDEMKAVKAREEELMMEALGLKPKTQRVAAQSSLEKHELDQLLRKGGGEQEQGADGGAPDGFRGLGYAPGAGSAEGNATVPGEGVPGFQASEQLPGQNLGPGPSGGGGGGGLPPPPKVSLEELERLRDEQEKVAKRARKEAKKAKKDAKSAKKESKSKKDSKEKRKHKKHDRSDRSPKRHKSSRRDKR